MQLRLLPNVMYTLHVEQLCHLCLRVAIANDCSTLHGMAERRRFRSLCTSYAPVLSLKVNEFVLSSSFQMYKNGKVGLLRVGYTEIPNTLLRL